MTKGNANKKALKKKGLSIMAEAAGAFDYSGERAREVSFPLGGIGTGSIGGAPLGLPSSSRPRQTVCRYQTMSAGTVHGIRGINGGPGMQRVCD